MNDQEKVARWYFRQFAGEHDPSWDEIPQHARDNCFKAANELLALIQPGEPVARLVVQGGECLFYPTDPKRRALPDGWYLVFPEDSAPQPDREDPK